MSRLNATTFAFHEHLSKVKPSTDPYPPPGTGKDKMRVQEALGVVMQDVGEGVGGPYGECCPAEWCD